MRQVKLLVNLRAGKTPEAVSDAASRTGFDAWRMKRGDHTDPLSISPGGWAGALQTDPLMYLSNRVYWIGAQVLNGCLS